MDALRPDFLGCYGYDKNTSPNIDALAEDGVLYENAYATATWTKPSGASILTGLYPRSIGVTSETSILPESEYNLQTVLKSNGFKSYGISANLFISPEFGFKGFDEFFSLQKDEKLLKIRKESKRIDGNLSKRLEKFGIEKPIVPHSEDINEKFFTILNNNPNNDIFLLAWSVDTHGPYFVRGNRSYFGNSLDDFIFEKEVTKDNLKKVKLLYCDMIRYNDIQFGKLISKLKEEGLYDESMIIAVSDHGDSFGDHNSILNKPIIGHSGIPYEEEIKIPLIIKFPSDKYAGRIVEMFVDLTDIYPTIMDILQIKSGLTEMQGRSLYPLNQMSNEKDIFVESQFNENSNYFACLRKRNYKYIKVDFGKPKGWRYYIKNVIKSFLVDWHQLYDLNKDPLEEINIAKNNPKILETLKNSYYKIVEQSNQLSHNYQKEKKPIDENIKKRLKDLGYFNV